MFGKASPIRYTITMEQSAFEQIASALRLKAYQSSRFQGVGEAEAEDIAQEVMLRLWQMHEDLSDVSRLGNLASLMARNLTIDHLRKVRLISLDEGHSLHLQTNANPATTLEEAEDERWLMQKLKQLPTTQHTILYMRQVERLSAQDIAQRLGISETSVSTLLSRARRSLLEEIKRRYSR